MHKHSVFLQFLSPFANMDFQTNNSIRTKFLYFTALVRLYDHLKFKYTCTLRYTNLYSYNAAWSDVVQITVYIKTKCNIFILKAYI